MSEASAAIMATIMGLRACGLMSDEKILEFERILNSDDPHWVIGGHVDLETNEFVDPDHELDYVGSYETYDEAYKVWRGKTGWTIDDATMRYFIVHKAKVIDPEASLFKTVLSACRAVDNGRKPHNVLSHVGEEFGELSLEVEIKHGISYKEPGKDGIVGEALDLIAAAIDQIYLEEPDITEAELISRIKPKLEKWKDKCRAQG